MSDSSLVPMAEMRESAQIAFKSGLLPESIRTPEQALTIALKGRELGMAPLQAFSSIYVVKGKPALATQTMLALALQRIPGLQVNWIETTPTTATVEIVRPPSSPFRSTFSMEDAKAAGITGNGTWKAYPREMLRWRALSSGLRVTCPDILQGMYSVEELRDAPSLDALPKAAPSPTGTAARINAGPAAPAPKVVDAVPAVKADSPTIGMRRDIDGFVGAGGKPDLLLAADAMKISVSGRKPSQWTDEEVTMIWEACPALNPDHPDNRKKPEPATADAMPDSDVPF